MWRCPSSVPRTTWISFGPIDLNHTAGFSRLRAPLDYWNALALVLAMAAPIALRVAVERTLAWRWRLAGLAALYLFVVVIALTYSRGGVVALVIAIAVATTLARARGHLRGADGRDLRALRPGVQGRVGVHGQAGQGRPGPDGREPARRVRQLHCAGGCVRRVLRAGQRPAAPGYPQGPGGDARRRAGPAASGSGRGPRSRRLGPGQHHPVKAQKPPRPPSGCLDQRGNRWVWWRRPWGVVDRPVVGWGAGVPGAAPRVPPRPLVGAAAPPVPLQFLAGTV